MHILSMKYDLSLTYSGLLVAEALAVRWQARHLLLTGECLFSLAALKCRPVHGELNRPN